MNNILLVFPYKLKDKKDKFNKIVDKFKQNGYRIISFSEIDKNFDVMSLPLYVKDAAEQLDCNLDRISVLSNVKEFIFIWYRAYNSLIDDFVYFIDSENYAKQLFNNNIIKDNLYQLITNFIGINNESIQGKIFLNLGLDNYINLFDFLFQNSNFQYFDTLSNFDYHKCIAKKTVEKTYDYKGFSIEFSLYSEDCREELVDLSGNVATDIKLDFDLVNLLIKKNVYFVDKLVIELYKRIDLEKIRPFLLLLFKGLKEGDEDAKNLVFNNIINYCEKEEVNFLVKTGLLSLLVIIKPEEEIVLKMIMKALREDDNNVKYHYFVLCNILVYLNSDKLKKHEDYYPDKKIILEKIARYFKRNLALHQFTINKRNKKSIAFVTDQLLSLNHSPTKLMLDYAKNFKKYHPEYKIKIFVEDNFINNPKENILPYFYSSVESTKCMDMHKKHLNNEDIDIYYSNVGKSKLERTKDIIQQIKTYNPDVIITTSKISISNEILYDYYPIIYMPVGGDYFINRAHVYLHGDRQIVLENNKKYKCLNSNNIYQFTPGVEFGEAVKEINPSDYDINKNEFIMVTVGNRLDAELNSDKAFVDAICQLLMDNDNIRWIIIGRAQLSYISSRYNELLGNKIIRISYEEDLLALYKICDIYINPDRSGGGISMAMAMNEGLPVITLASSYAGSIWVGKGNCVPDFNSFIEEINKMYKNKNYREKKGGIMKRRINDEFSIEALINNFINYFSLAKENFNSKTL